MDEEEVTKQLNAEVAVKEGGCPECEVKAFDTIFREADGKAIPELMNSMKNSGWEVMINHAGMIKFCEKCMQP